PNTPSFPCRIECCVDPLRPPGKADMGRRTVRIISPLLTQSGHRISCSAPLSCRASWTALLPRISHGAGAGVGRGVGGELAVEFADEHDAVGKPKLGPGRPPRASR